MDSLTHVVLGAAIGEAVLGKKLGRKAMLWGALADTIPDFDVFVAILFPPPENLLLHRGITHSLFFVTLATPLLAWLFRKIYRASDIHFWNWALLFFLGLSSHLFLDALTSYGTGWFEPFSSYRVSFNTIFVADPFYTLPFLTCLLVALVAKNNSPKRIKWNKAGLLISTTYLLFTIFNHNYIHHIMYREFERQHLKANKFIVSPTPLNNILWMAYSRDSLGAYVGYYSLLDKTDSIHFQRFFRNDSLANNWKNSPKFKGLLHFSKGNYILTYENKKIIYKDVRLGQMGGWENPCAPFIFSYELVQQSNGALEIRNTPRNFPISEAFTSLLKRIAGQ